MERQQPDTAKRGNVRIALAQPCVVAVSAHSEVEVYVHFDDDTNGDDLQVIARRNNTLVCSAPVGRPRYLEQQKVVLDVTAPDEECVLAVAVVSTTKTVSGNEITLLVLSSTVAQQVNEVFKVCARDTFLAQGQTSQSDVHTLIQAWENYFQYLIADLTSIILNPQMDDEYAYQIFCKVLRYFVLNKAYAPAQYIINLAIEAGHDVLLFGTPLTEKIEDLEALHISIQASNQ